jgi:hypothetical protein
MMVFSIRERAKQLIAFLQQRQRAEAESVKKFPAIIPFRKDLLRSTVTSAIQTTIFITKPIPPAMRLRVIFSR